MVMIRESMKSLSFKVLQSPLMRVKRFFDHIHVLYNILFIDTKEILIKSTKVSTDTKGLRGVLGANVKSLYTDLLR